MSYKNNNIRIGNNGAGVYVGNTEIIGGGINITTIDLYPNSSTTDVLLVNLTDAVATFNFYQDSALDSSVVCQPFEVKVIGNLSSIVNEFNVNCGDNSNKYHIASSIRKVASGKDNYGDADIPEFELVDNADEDFSGGTPYNSNMWDYISQSTSTQESFAGGWIVLTMNT